MHERRARAIPLSLWTIFVSLVMSALAWLVVPWWVAVGSGLLSISLGLTFFTQLVRRPEAVSVGSIAKAFAVVWAVLAAIFIVAFALAALLAE